MNLQQKPLLKLHFDLHLPQMFFGQGSRKKKKQNASDYSKNLHLVISFLSLTINFPLSLL